MNKRKGKAADARKDARRDAGSTKECPPHGPFTDMYGKYYIDKTCDKCGRVVESKLR